MEASSETPWRVSDAPRDFIENQLNSIVGVELTITSLEGKWKLSQNRTMPDHDGVLAALEKLESFDACAMAKIMKGDLPA
jgi:transcriptional regulator